MQLRGPARGREVALLVAGALAVATAGCSEPEAGSAEGFTYWSMWQRSEPQAEVLQEAIDSFEEDTGATVNVEWQGREVMTKVLPALSTGDVPDLIDQGWAPVKGTLVKNDQHTDLSDVYEMSVAGEEQTVREVIPAKYDHFTTTDDGDQYLVPYEILGTVIWFDKQRVPEVASSPPEDWDEFTDLLADLKGQGHSPLALDGDIAGYDSLWVGTALVRTLGPDGFKELVEGEDASGWDQPDVRQAVEAIESLVQQEYFIPGYDSSKFPAIQKKWAAGEADMLLMGSWAPSETGPYVEEGFEYAAFNFPQMDDDYSVPTDAIGFAIPKPADNADAAKEFIAYFMNEQRLSGISEIAKNLTPRTDIDAPEELADLQAMISENEVSKVIAGIRGDLPDYTAKVFDPLNQKLLSGTVTADEYITQIKQGQQQHWELEG